MTVKYYLEEVKDLTCNQKALYGIGTECEMIVCDYGNILIPSYDLNRTCTDEFIQNIDKAIEQNKILEV
ncbi:hypothetical protein R2F61_07510 [Mollicutes bacterium LVI A0078]|nr:hypothetical protein RZE84_07285 [Mollicutes bacterium LVI A0075]WOO90571.1 hypothetical protein R2F61_07510 [Mollicutes bacterium LVI A0078]